MHEVLYTVTIIMTDVKKSIEKSEIELILEDFMTAQEIAEMQLDEELVKLDEVLSIVDEKYL